MNRRRDASNEMSEEVDTDRVSVKTYVPAYQKSEWKEHADELGMSQSEFVRTMVQAGRRGFSLGDDRNVEQARSEDSIPGGDGLETRVQSALSADEPRTWDELVEELSDGLEDRLEDALDSLQDRNRVRYSGRDGGYVLTDE